MLVEFFIQSTDINIYIRMHILNSTNAFRNTFSDHPSSQARPAFDFDFRNICKHRVSLPFCVVFSIVP